MTDLNEAIPTRKGEKQVTPEHLDRLVGRSRQLCDQAGIEAALDRMAASLTQRVGDQQPLFLCVVSGGIITTGQLITRLPFHLQLGYVHATRYRGGTRGGEITWKAKPPAAVAGRTVVVVDDVLDGGITLQAIVDACRSMGATDVQTAVLIDKVGCREVGGLPQADHVGMELGNDYVYGFGLDYHEYLRQVPGIYAVHEDDI